MCTQFSFANVNYSRIENTGAHGNYPIDRSIRSDKRFVIYQYRIAFVRFFAQVFAASGAVVGLAEWRKTRYQRVSLQTEWRSLALTFFLFVEFMNYLVEMSIDFKFRRQLKWGFYSLELK